MLPVIVLMAVSARQGNISNLSVISNSISYVAKTAANCPTMRTVLQTLRSMKSTDYTYVSYLNQNGEEISPITATTLIVTEPNNLDALGSIGRIAKAKIGPFRAFFYKSTPAYHRRWYRLWRIGGDPSKIAGSFTRPGANDPCVGFTVEFQAMMDHFAVDDLYRELRQRLGAPSSKRGTVATQVNTDYEFDAKWSTSDRVVELQDGEEAGVLLNVIFKP